MLNNAYAVPEFLIYLFNWLLSVKIIEGKKPQFQTCMKMHIYMITLIPSVSSEKESELSTWDQPGNIKILQKTLAGQALGDFLLVLFAVWAKAKWYWT